MNKKEQLIQLLEQTLEELKNNQLILLKRGDVVESSQKHLYKETSNELETVKEFVETNGDVTQAYRFMQINLFMKHENFYMNLFDTKMFPRLFELFEFE